jgi:hypothetical protein
MRLDQQLDRDAETVIADLRREYQRLGRILETFPDRVHTMRAAQAGQPGAARYDGNRVSGFVTVLDDEDKPVPAVSDRTGEQAVHNVEHQDRAAADFDWAKKLTKQARKTNDGLERIDHTWKPRKATDKESRATPNPRGCDSCATIPSPSHQGPWWNEIWRSTTLDGQPLDLCRWCTDWLRDTGRLPKADELRRHQTGQRVFRPAS